MHYLLDTNMCIYIIKRFPPHVHKRFKALRIGTVGISAITYCELQFGIAKSSNVDQNQGALNEFLGPLEILDFPAAAAPVFGKIRAQLNSVGMPIGNYDLLIGTHALFLGATLVTNNMKEFSRIPGLST